MNEKKSLLTIIMVKIIIITTIISLTTAGQFVAAIISVATVCPTSLDPIYIETYVQNGSRLHGHTVVSFRQKTIYTVHCSGAGQEEHAQSA